MSNGELPPIQPGRTTSSSISGPSSPPETPSTQPVETPATTVARQTLSSQASTSAPPAGLGGRTVTPQTGLFRRFFSWIAKGFSRFFSYFLPTRAEQAPPPVPSKTISTTVPPERALAVISACAARVRSNIDTDGLFRVAGPVATVDTRTGEVNQQGFPIETVQASISEDTVHGAADLLKRVVEGMQLQAKENGHMPTAQEWIAAGQDVTKLNALIQQLPAANRRMLQDVLRLCRDTAARSEANRMTTDNLARMLAPRLFPDETTAEALQRIGPLILAAKFMIENCDSLFPVPLGPPPSEPAPPPPDLWVDDTIRFEAPPPDRGAVAVDLSPHADSSDASNAIARARRAILKLDPDTREALKLELLEHREYIDESADQEAAIRTCAEMLSNLIYDPNNPNADAASKREFAQFMIEYYDDLFPEEALRAQPSEPAPAPVTLTPDEAAFRRWLSPDEAADVTEQGIERVGDLIKTLQPDQRSALKEMLQAQNHFIAISEDKESAIQHGIDQIEDALRDGNTTRETIAQRRGVIRFMLENYDRIFGSSE